MLAKNPSHHRLPEPTVPGPIPVASPPSLLVPPPLACDAHCHVFGPAARFPFAPNRSYTPPDSGVDDFLVLQDRLRLQRAVFVQASCHGTDNSAMLDAIQRGNGRFAGVAMIDQATTADDIAFLHANRVRGIRFNFVAHLGGAPDLDQVWPLIRLVEPFGWHVVLHFDAKDLPRYEPFLAAMPVPYVIDHMARVPVTGGIEQEPFAMLVNLLATDERCWVKISGAERLTAGKVAPFDDVIPFARALIAAAPTRVLWGTDWPHPNLAVMPDEGHLLDLLAQFAPDEQLRRQILVDNPQVLYDFD